MKAFTFILCIFLPVIAMFFVFHEVFPQVSQTPQIFDDFIIENVSSTGYNKSAEITLFWVMAACCTLLTVILLGIITRKWNQQNSDTLRPDSFTAAILLKTISTYALLAGLSYYAVLAGLTVLVHFSPVFALSQSKIYLLTGIVFAAIVLLMQCPFARHNPDFCKQMLLLMQIPVPLLLVLFFTDRYIYQGMTLRIPYAPFYYVFFTALLAGFLILVMRSFLLNRNTPKAVAPGKLIHPVTAITVFIYNSYSACPMYAQPDQHHHGEQMIPWQQIVSFGQTAYDEYTPVSGLFPLINGFIQNVLLGGTVSDYSPAISITVVLFCILTMYLLYRHVGGGYAFLFAILFALPAYNRQYMVLPVLLLLFLKELLNNPGCWLKTWILSCFLAGLYYPLYGAAVLVGTTPLGITVLIRYLKQTDWKHELKKPKFYFGWGICLLPVLLCIPLLLRMVSHTLVYSGQTILADGISLFGQSVPDFFLPFLAGSQENIRLWLYYGFRFFLPIVPFALAAGLGVIAFAKRNLQTTEHTGADATGSRKMRFIFTAGTAAVILCLAVSYTYTLVRADRNMILSRTAPVLIAVAGMFLPALLISYGKKLIPASIRVCVIIICLAFPMMIYHQVSAMKFPDMWIYPNGEARLVLDDSDKLFYSYEVPETFIKMDEIDLPDTSMLGDGFMVADQVHYLTDYAFVMTKCEAAARQPESLSYLGMDGQGFYYYLNAKACATGFIQAGKGYDAQQRLLATIKEARPVIFGLEPLSSFYVYKWMFTEGDYKYSLEDQAFYPSELFAKLYPDSSGDDYRQVAPPTDFGRSAASFGNSAETILSNLPGKDIGDVLSVQLDDTLTLQANSLEIEFVSDGQLYDGCHITCLTGDGKLLIPLEMNACWLLADNLSDITLRLYDIGGDLIFEGNPDMCGDFGIVWEIL